MNQKQDIDKVLVFDVWGDYAHFRKFYTTTSPLSFSIPPRTALCGLIGAVIGLNKENNDYLKHFTLDKAFIGLKLINPLKKVNIAENLINTKDGFFTLVKKTGHQPRTQINFEFIKNPKYRVYFYHTNKNIYNKLKENLKNHKSVYTPCFGLSENIANFKFIGEFKVKFENSDEYTQINSVLPTEKVVDKKGVNFLDGEYFSIRIPIELNPERIVTKYGDILFERNGNIIEAKLIKPYCIINYNNGTKEKFVFIE